GVDDDPTATLVRNTGRPTLSSVNRCALMSTTTRYGSQPRCTADIGTHPLDPFGRTGNSTLSQSPSRAVASSTSGSCQTFGLASVVTTLPPGAEYTDSDASTACAT